VPDRVTEPSDPRPLAAGVSAGASAGASAAPAVEFNDVQIAYGKFIAVHNFSLSIEKGSFVTLLGPSGCGKTTLLRAVAGLVGISSGQIAIGGRRIDDVPIYKRNIGLVFQNYALFPHKTVFDNVAFGLKYHNVPKADIAPRVARALEMVRLAGSERKLPSQLSGGQQQRIALARAIVFEPEVLLLDEPLSALDANMREEMRVEIKKIQKQTGITAIFVTHDQEEALSMSDRIVVMSAGKAEQIGSPTDVYDRPATTFVADFLGKANLLAATVKDRDAGGVSVTLSTGQTVRVATDRQVAPGDKVSVVVRPQKLAVGPELPNRLSGRVLSTSYLGSRIIYEIDLGQGAIIRANVAVVTEPVREGETIEVGFDPADCVLL
jgi:spermidine/putrescine ABC transporter ATP-binding subunit